MKVLHVTPTYHPARVYGGPIRSGYGLTRALARAGVEVRVLTTNANGRRDSVNLDTHREHSLETNLRVRYAPRLALDSVSPSLLARLGAAVRWADVVHLTAVYSFPTIPTLVTARGVNKPLVWSPRGSLQRWPQTRRRIMKAVWESACRVVIPAHAVLHTTSDEEARQAQARMPKLRCVVIPNGVDMPERVRHVGSDQFRVLFLGRLDPIKGLENLLDACARLPIGVTLTVAGSGNRDYVARLRARAEELGLGARARFVGEVVDDEKPELFARTDVLVLPSHSENFGLVVAEALAHAVPVVASRGTPWQVLESGGFGAWVDNAPDSLARALLELRRADLRSMGELGRAWVAGELGWDAIAEQMLSLYRELIDAD